MKIIERIILFFFVLQLVSVNYSIAVTSIGFGVSCGLWLFYIFLNRSSNIDTGLSSDIKLISFFILFFLFFDIISKLFAIFPDGNFWGIKRTLLFLNFFIAITVIKSFKELFYILIIIAVVTALFSTYEIIYYFLTLGNELKHSEWGLIRINYFSYALTEGQIKMLIFLWFFPMLFFRLDTKTILDNKIFLALLITPIFISMFLTQSRNVYVALFLSFIIFGIIYNWKYLLLFIISLLILWFVTPSQYKARIASILDLEQRSNMTRLIMWDVGLKIVKDYPVTGVGESDKFERIYEMYKKIDPENPSEGTHLHNNILMVAVTYGIPGLLAFIGIFLIALLKHIKYYKVIKLKFAKLTILGCILSSIAFQIAGIFDYNYRDQKIAPIIIFTLSVPFVLMKLYSYKRNN